MEPAFLFGMVIDLIDETKGKFSCTYGWLKDSGVMMDLYDAL
jgi:hypothetical protein